MPLKNPTIKRLPCRVGTGMLLVLFGVFPAILRAADYPLLNEAQREWIGQQIFRNECNQQTDCLTSWNTGEEFPSMGIGHFIWYRQDQHEIFEESFPALLQYFQSQNIAIPDWVIDANFDSPWQNREQFLAAFDSQELETLRTLLAATMPQQTSFIVQRFESALNKILAASADHERENLEDQFFAIANSQPPYGMYALIDYVNFKGEGVSPDERYADQGWGLLQVLETMLQGNQDMSPLEGFVSAAKQVLQARVDNAPPERNESRWLEGWFNRVDTYSPPANMNAP